MNLNPCVRVWRGHWTIILARWDLSVDDGVVDA